MLLCLCRVISSLSCLYRVISICCGLNIADPALGALLFPRQEQKVLFGGVLQCTGDVLGKSHACSHLITALFSSQMRVSHGQISAGCKSNSRQWETVRNFLFWGALLVQRQWLSWCACNYICLHISHCCSCLICVLIWALPLQGGNLTDSWQKQVEHPRVLLCSKNTEKDKECHFDNYLNAAEGASWTGYIWSVICLFTKSSTGSAAWKKRGKKGMRIESFQM